MIVEIWMSLLRSRKF